MDYETPDILVRVQERVTIVRVKTENLTSMNDIGRLSGSMNRILSEGTLRLVIDFKLVKHIGSAALGLLISMQKQMKELGGRMIISHPEHIAELLEVSQTVKLFELAPDTKAAFELLKPE